MVKCSHCYALFPMAEGDVGRDDSMEGMRKYTIVECPRCHWKQALFWNNDNEAWGEVGCRD